MKPEIHFFYSFGAGQTQTIQKQIFIQINNRLQLSSHKYVSLNKQAYKSNRYLPNTPYSITPYLSSKIGFQCNFKIFNILRKLFLQNLINLQALLPRIGQRLEMIKQRLIEVRQRSVHVAGAGVEWPCVKGDGVRLIAHVRQRRVGQTTVGEIHPGAADRVDRGETCRCKVYFILF